MVWDCEHFQLNIHMKFKIQFQINLTWNHYADILFTDVAVKCQPMPTVTSAPRHTHRAKTIALQRITIPVPLTLRLDRTKFWEPAGLTVKRLLVQQQGRSRLNTRFCLFTYEMMNIMCMCNSYHLYEVGINEPSNLSEADVQELKNS